MAVNKRTASSTPETSHRMKRFRQRSLSSKVVPQSDLHTPGLRNHVQASVLTKFRRVATVTFSDFSTEFFVDSYSSYDYLKHATRPKANADLWFSKSSANQKRDINTDRYLREDRWATVRTFFTITSHYQTANYYSSIPLG